MTQQRDAYPVPEYPSTGQNISRPGSNSGALGTIAFGLVVVALAMELASEIAIAAMRITDIFLIDQRVIDFGSLIVRVLSAILMVTALSVGVAGIVKQHRRVLPAIAVGAAVAALFAQAIALVNRALINSL